MRIAITSSGLGNTARGIEAWAKSLAESLHREGEDVMLCHGGGTHSCPNIKLNYLHRDTLPIRLLTRLAPRFTWRWGLTSRYGLEQRLFTRSLLRWLRLQAPESRPDLIHTQDYVVAKRLQQASSIRHSALGIRHFPKVVFCNGTDEPPATLTDLPYLQHASQPDYDAAISEPALTGESPSLRTRTHTHTRESSPSLSAPPGLRLPTSDLRPLPRHFLAPNFVDTTYFTPATPEQKSEYRRRYGIPQDAFVIGCVAALQRHHKRLDSLIDEVAALVSIRVHPRSSVVPHLLLAGASTDDTGTIERYARDRLRLPRACRGGSNVTILKDQPFESMPSIYQSMDLYVHPAPEEVFGICLLEAMASGIPVVAHDSPRLQYVVGEGGWLTDVTKPGFLAEQWSQIQAELPAVPSQSRKHVETHFSWQAVYAAYMNMYREVVG
jgi:glycosyltransferase involved in cell wall biosynthesis